jgi:hypothetical protein
MPVGAAIAKVLGDQRGRPGDERDPEQEVEIEEEQGAMDALDPPQDPVVVDPDDPDREERDQVGGKRRP